jgi:NTE family protein
MFTPVEIGGVLHVDGMLTYEVPTTPLKQLGIDCVLGVHLRSHWPQPVAPLHFFEVIGQCFSIAQARMTTQWAKDADLLLEPNVDGFAYDDFARVDELVAIGEQSMRAALPALKRKLGIVDERAARPANRSLTKTPVAQPAD